MQNTFFSLNSGIDILPVFFTLVELCEVNKYMLNLKLHSLLIHKTLLRIMIETVY